MSILPRKKQTVAMFGLSYLYFNMRTVVANNPQRMNNCNRRKYTSFMITYDNILTIVQRHLLSWRHTAPMWSSQTCYNPPAAHARAHRCTHEWICLNICGFKGNVTMNSSFGSCKSPSIFINNNTLRLRHREMMEVITWKRHSSVIHDLWG